MESQTKYLSSVVQYINGQLSPAYSAEIGHEPADDKISVEYDSNFLMGYMTDIIIDLDGSSRQTLQIRFAYKNASPSTAIDALFEIANSLQNAEASAIQSDIQQISLELLESPKFQEKTAEGQYIYTCLMQCEIQI